MDVLIALGLPTALSIVIWQLLFHLTGFSIIVRGLLSVFLPSIVIAVLVIFGRVDQTILAVLSKLRLGFLFQVIVSAGIIAILELARSKRK